MCATGTGAAVDAHGVFVERVLSLAGDPLEKASYTLGAFPVDA